ncbi:MULTISPECIES: DUF1931 family protein [unclassified Pseudofrankia]|uniref:DUF1931 family protein n=1 Tax=unclassified Pseudofrankia TaxID=2994372 RepID=UPI0008D9BF36|nr:MULTISPECIES: DUF1931 family protein [unclassified Pseudofrankia]MDT3439978.1 DUF1931 family protein [Pseudofrankia sp. BMG5.37]OHV48437.1 hypothetical protein BCD48_15800 [Pseudofrankia sp. BMG5.36]
MPVIGVTRFVRFFRIAAGLDIDKNDLKRYSDFVNDKIYDLLLMAQATAKANSRDVIQPWDLPITKGLQESTHRFRDLDEEIELRPILEMIAARPPLDAALSDETTDRLPLIVGGLSLALAKAFTIIEPGVKQPATEEWERARRTFDLLL